jgi:type 1 glutamine amidotransferase
MNSLVTSLLALLSAAMAPAAPLQPQAASSAVTAAQAAPFAGDWTLNVTSPMGPATFGLTVSTSDGPVRATLTSEAQPAANISAIALVNGNLVLKYTSDYQGQPIPTVVTLTPKASALAVNLSMLDGQFEMSGTGTRGKPTLAARPAPGQPGPQPQVARVSDLIQMMAALPDSAPAVPKKPRRVLVLAKASGFVHASIPLAARTIEALGQRTGAWTTVISYDPGVITEENLKAYDAIFLASTTGTYLDEAGSESVTASRRRAFMEFIRGGKGLGVIHAGTDSYHGKPPGTTPAPVASGTRPPVDGDSPLWPEYNRMINGYFKWHWLYPTQIAVKIDDPSHPVNAPFTSLNASGVRVARPFSMVDEVYTFNETSWSRARAHVLTSIDYAKMPAEVKALEPPPQRSDHDYALSYLVREGEGRVFVEVLGHDESIYKQTPMLAHILAGMQYVLGDLEADDTPSAALPGAK